MTQLLEKNMNLITEINNLTDQNRRLQESQLDISIVDDKFSTYNG